jgi:hypothetical protein
MFCWCKFIVSQLQYIMALNELDRQIIFLNTFFPIKYYYFFCFCCLFKFVSNQCSSSTCNLFCLSFVSCLNSSNFLHFNLVYFVEFRFPLNSLSALDGRDHPLKN